VTFTAPIDGAVLEKMAVEGMRFMAGDTLYRLADLSVVWAIAEVSEQDLPWLRIGERARFETAALPGEVFTGRVDFLYPTVGARTRTARARIELPNAVGRLKPAMFGRVTLDAAGSDTPRLTVPASAVIDSGARQIVLVDRGAGRFEPREVGVGLRGAEYVEISSGLEEGEPVVVAANFLIDAESNLRGALAGMGEHQH
jgi:Cu(I)/Ag(I) efflux system membrane fusion protein